MTIPKINIQEAKQKTLKTGLNMIHIIIIGTVIYGLALSNSGIDYKSKPIIAQAQEIILEKKVEPLSNSENPNKSKVRNESTLGAETASLRTDKTEVNEWSILYQQSNKEQIDAIIKVSKKYDLDPRYLVAICLSESCGQTEAFATAGESSLGSFQINFAGTSVERKKLKWLDTPMVKCALDFECSADWTAYRITKNYGCKVVNQTITNNWIECLSKHNRSNPPQWYKNKIEKNGLIVGLVKS
jgi:hypothetical protein